MRPVLRGERRVELRLPPPAAERRRDRRRAATGGASSADAADGGLLAALKAWRRDLARAQGVPPYVVFHDRTLVEIAARNPATREELSGVTGIGRAKLERHGDAVLALLRMHRRG
ncbi:MAG: HRDC domain-containing protein [Alphaproteobacteria bacterium]